VYKKISDYGIIGNLHSVALIGLDGAIDWLCLPHIDSPSVFAALLDDEKGGRFSICPTGEWDSVADYLPGTNILVTKFRTRDGLLRLTDFMPVAGDEEEKQEKDQNELYRLVEVMRGKIPVQVIFDPRFDYARANDSCAICKGGLIARGNGKVVALASSQDLRIKEGKGEARWDLAEGARVWLRLQYGVAETVPIDPREAERALRTTETYWQNWLRRAETGQTLDFGPHPDLVARSALVLKLLYYHPTGTIAAAATTSLPEEIGGERNWDYRYTWLRDSSFTLQALFDLGHLAETQGYLKWIEKIIAEDGADKLQIMYGLRGERDLPEQALPHLQGYKGSKPVRIGNAAAQQRQLDIYGEVMDAALKLSQYAGKIDVEIWPPLRRICDHVVENWTGKDSGIWEVRSGTYHFVYSKVMCWVALDRGITIARRYGFPADLEKWERVRFQIKKEVLEKGWNEGKRSFVQHYDTDALDASNLLIPILGFLPFDDPRMVSTIEAIRRELGQEGFLYRYVEEDGLSGKEGTFLLCTFWLIQDLIGLGRLEEAEILLRRTEGTTNHLGLFSEEYDLRWKEALGNFPQAITHIGYVNSVVALWKAQNKRRTPEAKRREPSIWKSLRVGKRTLNEGHPRQAPSAKEIGLKLKDSMNVLRGAFFQGDRVAYEAMECSKAYREYLDLSYSLKKMKLEDLKSREECLAFWMNLYNVLVIHGVVALGIKDSVKEVWRFFKRVQYQIGDLHFTPHEIEHGILRGNRRPPASLFSVFHEKDPRLQRTIDPMDPRIHFTLVCASSSCPPIEVFTPENLEKELTVSGQTFLNAGGVKIDRKRKRVSLSRIFKWYGNDFGPTVAERLRFIAPFLYDQEDKEYLIENAQNVSVEYQDYDWRLNRS